METSTPTFVNRARFWIIGGMILLLGTIFFWIDGGKFDRWVTDQYYVPTEPIGNRFPYANQEPWHFFNEYNDIFTYILVVGFMIMLVIGLLHQKKYGFMVKYALFGFLSLAIGAGVIVNLIFKGLWGRPRPRLTTFWPDSSNIIGRFYFVWEPAWFEDPGLIGEGVSFPSGHVSVIAAYIILFYIFMHPDLWANFTGKSIKIFQVIKWGSLLWTFVGGVLTGFGRIIAGAHFASDVLWAFGMILISNAVLYYFVMKMPYFDSKLISKQTI
jgi:lipid A 4'-phosphatase